MGPELIGRVVDSLGRPIDGKGPVNAKMRDVIEKVAPGVIERQSVSQPVQTGLKAIDAMVPVGRGQRELIIGDRQTGKTAVAIDTIINQKGKDLICVYVAIGQKASSIKNVVHKLTRVRRDGLHDRRPPPPLGVRRAAVHRALFRLHDGRVFPRPRAGRPDHLRRSDQAGVGRTGRCPLLLRRPPGREAYPGELFYLHSRLLERGARVNAEYVESSRRVKSRARPARSTALPIIETQAGDVTAFVRPT